MAELPTGLPNDVQALENQLAASGSEPGAPEPQKKTKKKKKSVTTGSGNQVIWTVRLEQRWDAAMDQVREMGKGLRSPDRPTRRMAAVFFLSVFAFSITLVYATHYYYVLHKIHQAALVRPDDQDAKHFGEFVSKQAEGARHRYTTLTIGDFTIELKKEDDQSNVPGVVNMAEIEIVAECDAKVTCTYMEDHLPQVRNQITNVLTAVSREELLSREGKRRLKTLIVKRINRWLGEGKIENLYFSKLIIT